MINTPRGARTSAALLALALAAAACDGSPDSESDPAPPPAPSPALQTYYDQQPRWKSCQGGLQCATLEVPLDYAAPAGDRIRIAVARLPARKKSRRVGSLLVNPGGPGGSGISFVRDAGRNLSQVIQDRFDVVGFDPRGVGDSTPIGCLDAPAIDRWYSTDTTPDDRAELAKVETVSKDFAAGCRAKSSRLLPHVGTLNAARDMDVLRAALGDDKMNYLGLSYGTYLGAYYADLFPRNTRALVLDGAVDPNLSPTDGLTQQAKGFETALRAFIADCATQPDCPLGKDTEQALRKIADLQQRADRTPLAGPRPGTESWVTMGIATALYDKQYWPLLRSALTQAYDQQNGAALLTIADQLVERRPDGTYSNQTVANMAINCIDQPAKRSFAAYKKEVDKAAKLAPRFGSWVTWNALPCVSWSAKAQAPKQPTAAGAGPILVIGTTRDPATPYAGAQKLAAQLRSGVLLTLNGDGHTAYLQNDPCITAATDKYLITGTPPKDGTRCG